MSHNEPLIEQVRCPYCLGDGALSYGRAPLGATPDDVEASECPRCDGTGLVAAPSQCDCCAAEPAVAIVEGVRVGSRCLDQLDVERASYRRCPCTGLPKPSDWSELACDGYRSEAEAREGHASMVAKYAAKETET